MKDDGGGAVSESTLRQRVAGQIHELWTAGGSDLSGLALPLLDGRIDTLGRYVMMSADLEDLDDYERSPDEVDGDCDGGGSRPEIPRVHCDAFSYEEFTSNYMRTNKPVMIDGLTKMWEAKHAWVRQSNGCNTPDMQFLRHKFGDEVVPIYEQMQKGFGINRPCSKECTVSEYVDWWERFHAAEIVEASKDPVNVGDTHEPLLYLKDWKFVASHPSYNAYDWPHFFRDDWLNEAMGHAYKFVYVGPAGTSTVLHSDVLQSFSWSTNVCGVKRWYLIPPDKTYLLRDCFGRSLAPHLHADVDNGLAVFFPGLRIARKFALQVIQKAGETIFVPSLWYHTVENLEQTLSINHNWLNGANIRNSWETVEAEVRALPKAKRNPSSSNNCNSSIKQGGGDNSQIEDDLVLLWHVVSAKAKTLLQSQEYGHQQSSDDMAAVLYILRGMYDLVLDGYAPSLDHWKESIKQLLERFIGT